MTEIAEVGLKAKSLGCPLCGATPHHGLDKVEHCQLHGEPFQRFSIWCPKGHVKVTAMNEEQARKEWGERQPDPRVSALVEALEDMLRLVGEMSNVRGLSIQEAERPRKAVAVLQAFKGVPTHD